MSSGCVCIQKVSYDPAEAPESKKLDWCWFQLHQMKSEVMPLNPAEVQVIVDQEHLDLFVNHGSE